jgi:hypothetical protein
MHNGRFLTLRQVLNFYEFDNPDGVILGKGEVRLVRSDWCGEVDAEKLGALMGIGWRLCLIQRIGSFKLAIIVSPLLEA